MIEVKFGGTGLLIKIMCLLGLTTLLSSFSVISPINRLLMGLFILILLWKLFRFCTKQTLTVVLLTAIVYVYSLMQTVWPIENINEVFYFGMWILLFSDLYNDYETYVDAIKENAGFIRLTVIVGNLLVFVSFFMSSSYVGSAFYSFTGAQHRCASSMLLFIALSAMLMRIYGQKRYLVFAIIPIIAIMLTGARTYMIVGGIVACCLYYIVTEHKASFYLTIFPIVAIALYFIMNSDVMLSRTSEMERLGNYYGDTARALTSGRSVWLMIDLQHFWASSPINQLLGNGFHFIRYVNTTYYGQNIWAHNDYVMLLGTNGYLGLILYLYVYIVACRFIFNKSSYNKKIFLVICFHAMNLINAMLNMVYTYTATTLALVFLLMVFFGNDDFSEIEVFRRRSREELDFDVNDQFEENMDL